MSKIAMKHRALFSQVLCYSHTACVVAVLLSILIFSSYPLDIPWLYRPLTGGAATHPMTAFIFLLLSGACVLRKRATQAAFVLVSVACGFLAIRLQQQVTGINFIDPILSNFSFFDIPLHGTYPIKMGLNTSAMQLCSAIAIFALLKKRHWYLVQLFAIIAIFLPFVSAVGYAYGSDSFYGQMSPVTTILGCFLTVSIFGLTAHRGALKALLLPTVGAKIVRIQLICGLLFCLIGGFITTKLHDDETNGFAIYVVVVCSYLIFTMLISSITYEQFDKRRRFLEKKLHQSAVTDNLTGVCNRTKFDQKIYEVFERQNRHSEANCLLILDIDFFKNFNDTYGHLTGDKVLKTVARVLKNNIRLSDMVCRYGGEEFTILLPQTDIETAGQIAEKLRQLVSQQDLSDLLGRGSEQQITISIGCASLTQSDTVKGVIKLADTALYEAKRLGRNRVCLARDNDDIESYRNTVERSRENAI
ncbi:GGDEF domain-containing protein [Photobacterium sp. MCCC 1A19761]|uniref:GGDEF domain-containing protein n=1 Tax=Photobacterium sp. MCCC 1A19761 TaxID=3115000 RepID=UPI00307F0E46